MSAQQQYEEYLEGFTSYIDKLCNKVALFTYLKHKSKGDEVKLAPVFFLSIQEALLVDCVISLARLYEDAGRSDKNLNRFLNFVEGNIKALTWQGEPITINQIKAHRELIGSKKDAMEHVLAQRDKYFAHHDKEYFVDASKLGKDYPLTVDDVEELIRIAQEINCDHNFALNGVLPVPLHEFHVLSLDSIFQILRSHGNQSLLANQHEP